MYVDVTNEEGKAVLSRSYGSEGKFTETSKTGLKSRFRPISVKKPPIFNFSTKFSRFPYFHHRHARRIHNLHGLQRHLLIQHAQRHSSATPRELQNKGRRTHTELHGNR